MLADSSTFLLVALALSLAGVVLPLVLAAWPRASHALGCALAGLSSLAALLGAGGVLLGGAQVTGTLFTLAPLTSFDVRLDPLSALFLGLTALVGLLVSVYAYGYARSYVGRKNVAFLGGLLNAFLLSMALVPLANNVLAFLIAWEAMALVSFFLVAFEHERAATRRASVLYAIMTHLGAGFLFAAFLALAANAHGLGFDALRAAAPTLPAWLKDLAFVGFLIGFGTKSGVVPLHGWLPEAHPAAPSHVSALMSGVMIKTGLYGLLRVTFDLMGGGPAWWGGVVLALGCITAVLGALFAVVELDLKRLLAFSSVENVGIMLIGVGAALLFAPLGHTALAALAIAAALYHVVNHGVFKSLLFCGAGAVLHATHTTQLDQMGGLIKRMPRTAFLFLVGAAAISALPLLNGFVSEWLTFQALLGGFGLKQAFLNLILPLAACALALTGGLALVAFVKAFAGAFLAKPRSEAAAQAHEADGAMQTGMALMALACLALGVLPGLLLPMLDRIVRPLTGAGLPSLGGWLLPGVGSSTLSTPALLVLALVGLAVSVALPRLLGGRTRVRVGPTWGCGGRLDARTQYTAGGYAQPLRQVFGRLLLPHARELRTDANLAPVFKRELNYKIYFEPVFEKYLYGPLTRWTLDGSHWLTRIQGGSVHLYLAYIFVALLAVLLLMRGMGA